MKESKFIISLLIFTIVSCGSVQTKPDKSTVQDVFVVKSMGIVDNGSYTYINFAIGYNLPHIRNVSFAKIKEDSIMISGELYKSSKMDYSNVNILSGEDENNSEGRINHTILKDVQNGQKIKFTISLEKTNCIIIQHSMSDSSYIYQFQ